MNLCNYHHDEICFEGHTCPLCVLKDDTDSTISSLQDIIDTLRGEMEDLKSEMADLQAETPPEPRG